MKFMTLPLLERCFILQVLEIQVLVREELPFLQQQVSMTEVKMEVQM